MQAALNAQNEKKKVSLNVFFEMQQLNLVQISDIWDVTGPYVSNMKPDFTRRM